MKKRQGRERESADLVKLIEAAAQAIELHDAEVEILQAAQAIIPAPTPVEVAEMRQGRRPLSREAYLLGTFQRAIVGAENLASDLRAIDRKTLRNVAALRLSAVELNAIEVAVAGRKNGRGGEP